MAGQPLNTITAKECAVRVFKGIAERRFWIFTHPFNSYLMEKMEAVAAGKYPTYSEVTFDEGAAIE